MTHDKEAEMSYRSGYYNACDGNGWQKQTTTLSVDESMDRDDLALAFEQAHSNALLASRAPKFKVGDVVRTREEYEALPVGAVVSCDDTVDEPRHDGHRYIERLHVTFVGHEYSARWECDAEDLAEACRRIIFLP